MKSNLPLVSIVVPVRNEEKNLPRLLDSIKKLDYSQNKFELIIVDGYSTDETVKIAKRFGAKIFKNPGKIRSTGCQIGVSKAQGEFIAFTDADCSVPSGWLKGLLGPFKTKNIAAVGGPNVTPKDDTLFAKAAGEALWLLARTGSRYGFSGQKVVEIYHNPGCNVIYRKKAIQSVGGFNPYLLTCEDEELDFRLRQTGYKLLFTPNVVVDHYRRPTYRKIYIQAYRFAIGRSLAIKMHWKMASWFHFGPTLLLLSLLASSLPVAGLLSVFFYPAAFYLAAVSLAFLTASWYLSLTKRTAAFYVYLLIFFCWFSGWGLGFIIGFFHNRMSR